MVIWIYNLLIQISVYPAFFRNFSSLYRMLYFVTFYVSKWMSTYFPGKTIRPSWCCIIRIPWWRVPWSTGQYFRSLEGMNITSWDLNMNIKLILYWCICICLWFILQAVVNVIGMNKMTPPIKDLLPRLTPILKNRYSWLSSPVLLSISLDSL